MGRAVSCSERKTPQLCCPVPCVYFCVLSPDFLCNNSNVPIPFLFQPTNATTVPDGQEVKFTMDVSCVTENYEFK